MKMYGFQSPPAAVRHHALLVTYEINVFRISDNDHLSRCERVSPERRDERVSPAARDLVEPIMPGRIGHRLTRIAKGVDDGDDGLVQPFAVSGQDTTGDPRERT